MADHTIPFSDDLVFIRSESRDWIRATAERLAQEDIPHHVAVQERVVSDPFRGIEHKLFSWSLYARPEDEARARFIDQTIESSYVGHVPSSDGIPSFDEDGVFVLTEERTRVVRARRIRGVSIPFLSASIIVGVASSVHIRWAPWWVAVVLFFVGMGLWRWASRVEAGV